jgi:serine O-acetyltransferase
MSTVFKIIKTDLYRHEGLSGIKGFMRGWFKPGFRYTCVFRLYCAQKGWSPLKLILRFFKRRYKIRYGFEISTEAQIGEGFYLSDHCGPVIIGPSKIGKHCNIAHSVTIGRTYKDGETGFPTIGDRVWIGTGSVLVGKITIGSNVMIAPNSFLNQDVPDHSLVMGNPAKIIRKLNPEQYYINNILNE